MCINTEKGRQHWGFLLMKLHQTTSSPPVLIGCLKSLLCFSGWATCFVPLWRRKKKFRVVPKNSDKALGWLTNECFAFASSSTFIPQALKYSTEVTAGIRQSGGCLYFFPPNDADTGQHELELCKAACLLWSALVKSLDLPACETWSSGEIFFEMER